jgi:RNA 2',3'-cyclic 3'-phosphodiesterase
MRLFVAAYPSPEACNHLAQGLAGLHTTRAAERGVHTRPARPENWHVTLVFLGEVAEDRAEDARAALDRAVAGWRATGAGPPRLRLAGGGTFGRGRFTVLWVGADGDREPLVRLARRMRAELKRDRLPYDDRPLKPHLTVARPGDRLDRADVLADRAALAGYRGPEWPVRTVELVRSHLGPKPWYEHLAAFPLGSGSE